LPFPRQAASYNTFSGTIFMKIAQVLRRFAFEEWGGTETVVWNSAQALLKLGIQSNIIATKACSADTSETKLDIPIDRLDYFYPCFPMTKDRKNALDKKGGDPVVPQLPQKIQNGHFDLIHLHTGGRPAQAAVAACPKLPYVMSFHGGCYDVPQNELLEMMKPTRHTFRYGRFIDYLKGWRRNLIQGASGLICVGQNEAEIFREKHPDKKVIYLPNGVTPELFRQKSNTDIRQEIKIPQERKIILCVSRIDYQKDQKFAVEAISTLKKQGKDVQLLLMGPVSAPSYFQELKLLVSALGMENYVTIIPGLPAGHPTLLAAYSQADYFLLPSRHEPFGIVALEAWSAGLPVIASKVGGLDRLVEDKRTGVKFNLATWPNSLTPTMPFKTNH